MSLRDTHDELARRELERLPAALRQALDDMLRGLAASGVAAASLKAGDRIPDFELPNAEGRLVSSRELLARGPAVLSFFRGDWCPYCRAELQAYEAALAEIEELGASLVAITPDTGAALVSDKRQQGLSYEVLGDLDNGLALSFGILFRVPDPVRRLFLEHGRDLGARHGNDAWFLPIPASYVVDSRGTIRHAELNVDFRFRMEPAAAVALLRRLKQEKDSGDA